MTNHFVSSELAGRDEQPIEESSPIRYDRLTQLLEPDHPDSWHSKIDPVVMTKILRDRTNPYTFETSDVNLYDDNMSPGGNGSLRQVTFDPERKLFWIAAGEPPVPENPFLCFSLDELLELPNGERCAAPAIE